MTCALESRLWAGSLELPATDLSAAGLWIETDLPLGAGERVDVRFTPPRWPGSAPPLVARARVAHAVLGRRPGDRGRAGMGLAFDGLATIDAGYLALALRGLPPPLPIASSVRAARAIEPVACTPTRIDDGEFGFSALAPLLTSSRLAAPPPAGLGVVIPFPRVVASRRASASSPAYGRVVRLRPRDRAWSAAYASGSLR